MCSPNLSELFCIGNLVSIHQIVLLLARLESARRNRNTVNRIPASIHIVSAYESGTIRELNGNERLSGLTSSRVCMRGSRTDAINLLTANLLAIGIDCIRGSINIRENIYIGVLSGA